MGEQILTTSYNGPLYVIPYSSRFRKQGSAWSGLCFLSVLSSGRGVVGLGPSESVYDRV